MKITLKRTSPNYRQPLSTQRIMNDLTIAILAVCVFAVVYNFTLGSDYGIHALLIIAISCITALVTEVVFAKVTKKPDVKKAVINSFPLVTALLFALTLPVGTPYYVVAIGAFIAIFFGKLIYGGFGQNIFNPALVGRVVVHLSYGAKLTTTLGGADAVAGATPLTAFASTNFLGEVTTSLGDLFLGLYGGALGETCTVLILLCGVYLAYRKVIDTRITLSYLGTVVVLGMIQGIVGGINPITAGLVHLAMGGAVFGAVFMATDPVTSPTSPIGKVIFGMGCGFITMLIRLAANFPEGVLFSILIMNMFTPMIDNFALGRTNVNMVKKYATVAVLAVISAVSIAGVSTALEPVIDEPEEPVVETKPYEIVSKSGNAYVVSTKGFAGNMEIEVTFDGDTIVGMNVLTHNETDGYGKTLIEAGNGGELNPNAQVFHDTIIKGTSVTKDIIDGADTATGATITSKAIITALNGALEEKANDPIVSAKGNVYVVRGEGFNKGNKMKVEVTMDKANSTVKSVKVLEYPGETDGYGKNLIEAGNGGELNPNAQAFHDKVLGGSFSYDEVSTIDTATGATMTSKGILNAVQTAIDTYATVLDKSPNGVYTLQAAGFNKSNPMTVEVKVNGSKVDYVKVIEYPGETEGYGKDMIEVGTGGQLNPNAQTFHDTVLGGSFSTDSISEIDTATGASMTAKGIMEAVNKAVAADNQ